MTSNHASYVSVMMEETGHHDNRTRRLDLLAHTIHRTHTSSLACMHRVDLNAIDIAYTQVCMCAQSSSYAKSLN